MRRLVKHGFLAQPNAAWIKAQISHIDPNPVRGAYNHVEYVEQRRRMMQDWADRRIYANRGR